MSPFLEALYDLSLFIKEAIFGKVVTEISQPLMVSSEGSPGPTRPDDARQIDGPLLPPVAVRQESFAGLTRAYVAAPRTKVLVRPVWAFDTVIGELDLGREVSLLGFEGRFVRVETESVGGWVLKDAICNEKADVWPNLITGVVYDANHQSTIRIRQVIEDAFFASELFLSLQPQEYIAYVLLQQNRKLPEVTTRPRLVGKWHDIYKGKLGVTIGLEPKAGSVMEALALSAEPFLGLVTAVHADESIVVESIGRLKEGEFLRETLPKAYWLDMQPVFMQF